MTLLAIIDGFAARGERIALQMVRGASLESWTYSRLSAAIEGLAARLHALSPRNKPAIALCAPSAPEWVAAYFAIIRIGGTAVPIDVGVSDEEAVRLAVAADCRLWLSPRDRIERLRVLPGSAAIRFLDPGAMADAQTGAPPPPVPEGAVAVGPDTEASLLFTSGTTGTPKIVPLTHRNLMHSVDAVRSEGLVAPGDRVLLPLPLHHIYPFTVGLLSTLTSGGTVIFPEGLSGLQIVEAMQRTGPDILVGVPCLYDALLLAIEGRVAAAGGAAALAFRALLRFSIVLRRATGRRIGRLLFPALHRFCGARLRRLACGGARLEEDTWERLEGLGWEVLTGYGLTETAPLITLTPPGRGRSGTEGKGIAGVEIRIDPGEGTGPGEILVRGPNVFSGYRNDPERTRAAFLDDWFRTGDLGSLDADGYLRVAGRADELIVLPDGKKIFPERLERAYSTNPYLRELAILVHQGRLVAIVVPDLDALRTRGTARIKGLINDQIEVIGQGLARYERVSGTAIVTGALPRTRLGKLRRRLLPEIYTRAIEAAVPAGAGGARPLTPPPPGLTPIETRLWEWLGRRFPGKAIAPGASLQLDLGIDSVDWIHLSIELHESLGVRLTDQALSSVISVSDLMRAVSEAEKAGIPEPIVTAGERRWLEPRGPFLAAIAWCICLVLRLAFRAVFRLRVEGREHLPATGPLVIAPNHASFLDPFAMAAALPWRLQRDVYWAAWTGHLFASPLRRFASRVGQAFPVDPDRGPAAGLALAGEVLARKQIVVWFPEGQRSPTGEMLPFLTGVGILIAGSGSAALPVHLSGTYEALPRNRLRPRRSPIRITIGEPATAVALEAEGIGSTVEARITDALHRRVTDLARKAQ
ncbi:MAG: AMP-binding protein [Gammaproteobacteria bacterium]|nr:AMP-binding protein [Gammaproteobacteria bacterium]